MTAEARPQKAQGEAEEASAPEPEAPRYESNPKHREPWQRGQEHRPGLWHGYPVQWREVPAVILREWKAGGQVSRRGLREHW
jgi:hypothetical protein